MKIEALFLLFLGVFFGIVGLVYWFTSYEDGGTMMLSATSLLGFFPRSYYMFWHRRMGKRVGDRDDEPIADSAGAINSFPGRWCCGIDRDLGMAIANSPRALTVNVSLASRALFSVGSA